jgi:hypothetical protein
MAEELSRELEKEILTKRIPEIKITQGARRVNHSHFADDTLML